MYLFIHHFLWLYARTNNCHLLPAFVIENTGFGADSILLLDVSMLQFDGVFVIPPSLSPVSFQLQ